MVFHFLRDFFYWQVFLVLELFYSFMITLVWIVFASSGAQEPFFFQKEIFI